LGAGALEIARFDSVTGLALADLGRDLFRIVRRTPLAAPYTKVSTNTLV
jgi:hypothetical protein